jgi:tetratricopeptide (TPR) repeat protein
MQKAKTGALFFILHSSFPIPPRWLMRRLAFAFALIFAFSVRADTLVLDDGTRVEGKAHKDGEQWIVIDDAGHETDVPAERIVSFVIGGPQGGDSGDDRLESLRDSVKALSDLPTIIERYRNFIDANPDSDLAKKAQGDLEQWQAKLDAHDVKVGDGWITPAEHAAMIAGEAETANRIGLLIQSDQYQDASDAAVQALAVDPQDPAALYLHGVVLFDLGQTLPAREEFQKSDKLAPHRAATLNNLGVLFSKQQAYAMALADYAEAMKVSPVNQTILDNVAEALHATPDDQQKSPAAVAAADLFADQDKVLQQQQAAKGLCRWGATWVSQQQLQNLQAEEQQISGQMAMLQTDYQNTVNQINSDNLTINQDQQNMQQMQQFQQYSMPSGTTVRGRVLTNYSYSNATIGNNYPPQAYSNYQSEITRLQGDQQTQMQHLADLRKQAAQLQQTVSVPKYSGVQKLIGPEGTPMQGNAAVQPAPAQAGG